MAAMVSTAPSIEIAVRNLCKHKDNLHSLGVSDHRRERAISSHVGELIQYINNVHVDPADLPDDAAAALRLLAMPDAPVQAEQKQRLMKAIRDRMDYDFGNTIREDRQSQEDAFIEHHLSQRIWDLAVSCATTIDAVLYELVNYCINVLKLRYPSEATRQRLVAVVCSCMEWVPTTDEALKLND